jgi:hypothetical protein
MFYLGFLARTAHRPHAWSKYLPKTAEASHAFSRGPA